MEQTTSWARRPGRVGRRLTAILLLAAALIMIHPSAASAHAVLLHSSPTDGARLDRMPAQVSLQFDESVGIAPGAGEVFDAAGKRVDAGTIQTADNGRTVIIPITASAQRSDRPGRFLISYRVISADSHVVTGSVRFGVGEGAGNTDTTSSPQPTDRVTTLIDGLGAGLGYAGLILAAGAVAIALTVWRSARRSPRLWLLAVLGSVSIMVGAIVSLITSGIEIGSIATVAETLPGRLLQLQILLAAIALPLAWGVLRPRHDVGWLRWCWAIGAAAMIVAVAARGHASSGTDRVVAMIATVGHLLAMCGWVGGLLVLVVVIAPRLLADTRAGRPGMGRIAARALASWSRLAFGCVAVLIISGEVLAWRQIQPIEGLWRTPYGITLLIKLGLVAVALTVALGNQRIVAAARRWIRWPVTLTVELAVMATVIIAATVLSSSQPAVDNYGPPVTLTEPIASDQLQVRIDPTRRGPQLITVQATDDAGQPLRLRSLSGQLSSTQAGVSAVDVTFRRTTGGWRSTDAIAPLPGSWQLQLSAGLVGGPAYVVVTDYQVW